VREGRAAPVAERCGHRPSLGVCRLAPRISHLSPPLLHKGRSYSKAKDRPLWRKEKEMEKREERGFDFERLFVHRLAREVLLRHASLAREPAPQRRISQTPRPRPGQLAPQHRRGLRQGAGLEGQARFYAPLIGSRRRQPPRSTSSRSAILLRRRSPPPPAKTSSRWRRCCTRLRRGERARAHFRIAIEPAIVTRTHPPTRTPTPPRPRTRTRTRYGKAKGRGAKGKGELDDCTSRMARRARMKIEDRSSDIESDVQGLLPVGRGAGGASPPGGLDLYVEGVDLRVERPDG